MSQSSFSSSKFDQIRAVAWEHDSLKLIDQRILPHRFEHVTCRHHTEVATAIQDMVVRGAPAIGIAAAYGVVLAARDSYADHPRDWRQRIQPRLEHLRNARPTAVNLGWAINRMELVIDSLDDVDPVPILLEIAQRIHDEDIAANHKMGEMGASMISPGVSVITHCNTGALATGGYGTALGVIRAGAAAGRIAHTFVDETRPWLQGSRLTAWELQQEGIPASLIADNAASHMMARGGIEWAIVGSDRIAANGDVANKIGTYQLAIAARYHGVKFMVVAPSTTVDMETAQGSNIPIEMRDPAEVGGCGHQPMMPEGFTALNPAFDVTPAELVDVIVTEKGIVERPTTRKMAKMMGIPG